MPNCRVAGSKSKGLSALRKTNNNNEWGRQVERKLLLKLAGEIIDGLGEGV